MKHSVMLKAWSKMLRPYVERYESWYEEILHITRCTGGEEKQPRVVGRQQNRSNHQNPKKYYKIAILDPFCDEVLMQLSSRFSEDSKV